MRYLARYIDPQTGQERLGTLNTVIGHYKTDKNAFRYLHTHLRKNQFPAGQYRLYRWVEGPAAGEFIGYLYKMA